jgi:uncharacterized OB-fold protein
MQSTQSIEGSKKTFLREGIIHLPSSPGDKAYLIGSRCKLCGRSFFPKRSICPDCFEENTLEEKALSPTGKLYSYYISTVAPPGFEAPLIAGYIDLPEGVRLYAPLTGFDPNSTSLEIETKMMLVIDKVCEDECGNEVIGYKFKPWDSKESF